MYREGIYINSHKLSWPLIAGLILGIAGIFYLLVFENNAVQKHNNNPLAPIDTAEKVEPQYMSAEQTAAQNNTPAPVTPTAGRRRSSTSSSANSGSTSSTSNPSSESSQLFVVYGDTRTNHDIHTQIVGKLSARNPVAVMHVGDLVADGTIADQWVTFNSITAGIHSKLFPVLGNHENNSQLYFDNFVLPGNERYYKLSYDRFEFIALDTEASLAIGSDQYNWLSATLAATDRSKFTVVYFHYPPFGTGKATEDQANLKPNVLPLFENNGVDIVFSGDHHDYERSYYNNIYYIVTGGGGAPLNSQVRTSPYSQLFLSTYEYTTLASSGNNIIFRAYNQSDNLIDSLTVANR